MNLVLKFFLTAFIVFSFQVLASSNVYAHVLETDGTIGAVLHIDPEDDPIAGQPSGFFFEFKDKDGKFKPQDCDCLFTVLEDGKQFFSQPLFASSSEASLTSATVFFNFPKKSVYQIEVVGTPIKEDLFQSFTLVYDVRVAREGGVSKPDSGAGRYSPLFVFVVIASVLGVFALFKRRR